MVRFMAERWPALMAMGMPPPKNRQAPEATQQLSRVDLSLRVDQPIAADGTLHIVDVSFPGVTVRHFPGHFPGGICLIVSPDNGHGKIMLCGDTLLYPITPHPDDLVAYLRTLKGMKALTGISLTLPAHGIAIQRLPERLAFIEQHHERRLRMTYEACRKPRSVWQIATMTGYFDVLVEPTQFNPLAGQEAWVHAELLQLVGGLHRTHIRDGVHYFENSGEEFAAVYARIRELINDEQSTLLMRR
jgi:glyoxylase-like metal-dependent hydrolase (beta-lactamase superfamily II)